ncbi:denticleless protein homolog [Oscarella lobularis]|uniref:denticleless protein homolog n=1 Tax=Oscarella lobularis TaxID=121494 RepID=UPI003313354E
MNIAQYALRRQFSHSVRTRPAPWAFYYESLVCYADDEHVTVSQDDETLIPPFVCSFGAQSRDRSVLAVADEEGSVQLIDSNRSGQSALIQEWRAHANAIFDLCWADNDVAKLLTGSGDQKIVFWDTIRCAPIQSFCGHGSSVKSVKFRKNDSNVFVSGSRDGSIRLWDARCNASRGHGSSALTIPDAHVTCLSSRSLNDTRPPKRIGKRRKSTATGDQSKSVTCAVFQGDATLISSGASDSVIKGWDIRMCRHHLKPVKTYPYPKQSARQHGYSHLVLDSTDGRLFANCTDDNIYMYDCSSQTTLPLASFRGHLNASFYVKTSISVDDRFLLSGSSDHKAYMWQIDSPDKPPFVLTGHAKEVTSVAWCRQDATRLATCSDDNSVRIWRLDRHANDSHKPIVGQTRIENEIRPSPPPPSSPTLITDTSKRQPSILSFMRVIDEKENQNQSMESGYSSDENSPTKKKLKFGETSPSTLRNVSNTRVGKTITQYFSPNGPSK